jgi:putative protease
VTKAYRESLDKLSKGQEHFDGDVLEKLQQNSPREFGLGTYRFRQSRDSI